MPVDAIVRVSFQSSVAANRATHAALTGVPQGHGTGPFVKVNTAVYECIGGDEAAVVSALATLGQTLITHALVVDFVSISLTRQRPRVVRVRRPTP